MSKLFVADPVVLKKECIKIGDGADMFVENNKKIFSTVREIMSSSYISPAARAIGEKILSFQDELDAMAKVQRGYSNFLGKASNTVSRNEQGIIDQYAS